MMKRQFKPIENIKYHEDAKVQVLSLPYSDEDAELVVFLPRENNIDAFLKQLDGKRLHELRSATKQTAVYVSEKAEFRQFCFGNLQAELPRFVIKNEFKLAETLQKLGFSKAFSQSADLTGIADDPLVISDAIHKAFVEVC